MENTIVVFKYVFFWSHPNMFHFTQRVFIGIDDVNSGRRSNKSPGASPHLPQCVSQADKYDETGLALIPAAL